MKAEKVLPIMKPWSIALFMAQPPMPNTMTYMQKLRTKSRPATGFNGWLVALAISVRSKAVQEKGCGTCCLLLVWGRDI